MSDRGAKRPQMRASNPAVGENGLPGDEAGGIAGQEAEHRSDLFGTGGTAE
jgi:hypothetical protein